MKQTLLLPFVLSLTLMAAQAQQKVAVYYNQKWEVTKKENAAYTRLATIPDSLIKIGHLFTMPFDKAVADYYSSGRILARGNYSKGQKQSDWLFYYPNGQLQCQAKYQDGKPAGTWKLWREDGQQEKEVAYEGEQMKMQSLWSKSGQQTVVNGTGGFEIILPDTSYGRVQLTGRYLNGVRHGTWLYTLLQNGQAAKPVMQQEYQEGGLIDGQTAKLGERMSDLLMRSTFSSLQPNFFYLAALETWKVDTSAFRTGYPVLAHMLKLNTQETLEKQEATQQVWSYRVVLPSAVGSDTLVLLKQTIRSSAPEFPGGEKAMKIFLSKHIRYPAPAQYFGIEGMVVLSVFVRADGVIGDVRIIKSAGTLLDDEALRAAKQMPPWKPAVVNNVSVAGTSHLAVKFFRNTLPHIYSVDERGNRN